MDASLRIASLIPSGTDILAALGLTHALVGVSHECDHPDATGKPVLTSSIIPKPAIDGAGPTPQEVDRLVVDAVRAGESLYHTHRSLLHSLSPTVVLSQDVCDVCAVNGEQAACDIPLGCQLVMLSAISIDGLYQDLRRVGEATSTLPQAEATITQVSQRLAAVEHAVSGRAKPKVLTLEWGDPPFLGGHWVPELVERAGGTHLLSSPGSASRRATWEEIALADPDILVFMPCGYHLEEAAVEASQWVTRPEIAGLRAVKEGRLWITDATALFSRCTPIVARAGEILGGIFHPGVLPAPLPHEARLFSHTPVL